MTVTATNPFDLGTGNGAAKTFPFSFRTQDQGDIDVYVDGVLQGIGYTVTIDGDGEGGSITFDTAPANGAKVVILSAPSFLQSSRFGDSGPYLGSSHDAVNDAGAIRDIHLKGETQRSIKAPVGEAFTGDLPSKTARAGKFLSFDALGNPVVSASSTGADATLRTDLTGEDGGGRVSFKQGFTGAVGTSILIKAREIVSVFDAGVVGDGLTDDLAAMTKLHNALNTGEISGYEIPRPAIIKLSGPLPKITRSFVSIRGCGTRQVLFKPQGNFDCMHIGAPNPALARVSDIHISGIGFDQGDVNAPTAGLALRLSRIDRSRIEVDVRNFFQSVLIEGGADVRFGLVVGGPGSWSGVAAGSYGLKLTNYAGTTEVPSEMTFEHVNWKGANSFLEYGAIVQAADGLTIGPGHSGFANKALWWINPQANAALSIQNIEWIGHYMDGNSDGSVTGAALQISGSTLPVVAQLKMTGGFIRGFAGLGIRNYDSAGANNVTQLKRLDLNGVSMSNIGKEFISLRGMQRFGIRASFTDGNISNTGGGTLNGLVFDNCGHGKMDLQFDPQFAGKAAFGAAMRFINNCHDIRYGIPDWDAAAYGALTTNDGTNTNVGA